MARLTCRRSHSSALTDEERQRFSRQLSIPGFGEEQQTRLREATVLVTRVGGLGGPAALYLAMAGVGRLIIAHGGPLELADLNRQLLMRHDAVGRPRIDCAPELFRRLAPACEVVAIGDNPSDANVRGWVAQADVVCDCPPSFEERFAINRACVAARRPMVEAAMYGLEGQLTTVIPGETACLACLVPEPPGSWDPLGFPVLGAVSGALGCLAAVEAVKLLTGVGAPLRDRLLVFDLATMEFRKLTTRRRPGCAVCGHLQPGPRSRPR